MNVQDVTINQYTYQTFWSKEDDSYVATVFEFPGLSWLEQTPEHAVSGLRSLVEEVIEDMLANGEQVPTPVGERDFSGKFNEVFSPGKCV
ncbi:MAG: toxin-antitoxin system HicB family antitoxin [Corynebacterium sp.]|uniref:toxin-antitoxin system HicB family antitoxin n=1 Tax=Corynebacterium sp. TaxID=1720 RepID=UPI0026DCE2D1|nr:toxin-antitoxin system HicB family antitoxin [Corynebacterium sp.]MDO4760865.1 toxin-antitoxin system HicB family antitoxin [Corynebacterium sp.]